MFGNISMLKILVNDKSDIVRVFCTKLGVWPVRLWERSPLFIYQTHSLIPVVNVIDINIEFSKKNPTVLLA